VGGWCVELARGIGFGSWRVLGMGIEGWVGIGWFGDRGKGWCDSPLFCVCMLRLRCVGEGM